MYCLRQIQLFIYISYKRAGQRRTWVCSYFGSGRQRGASIGGLSNVSEKLVMGQSKWLLQNKNKNQTNKTMGGTNEQCSFLGSILWCSQSGNDLDEDVAKFGYKLNLKIEILKHPFKKQI
jgi:hypothetical protein